MRVQDLTRQMARQLRQYAGNGSITIGIHDDARDYPELETGLSADLGKVVFIGYIHEMGLTAYRKYYKWLYKAIDANRQEITEELIRVFRLSENNRNRRRALLDQLGETEVKKVRKNVDNNTIGLPANEESTLIQKGRKGLGNTPMVATGHLVSTIDYKVGRVE